jgi:hypothetical protein
MKSTLCTIVCIFLHLGLVYSQMDIGVGIGYGFPWAVEDIPEGSILYFENGSRQIEVTKASFGAGRDYTLSISHQLKNNTKISIGCDINYLQGANIAIALKSSKIDIRTTYKSSMLWISPSLKINFNKNKVSPYMCFSPSIGLFGKISENYIGNRFAHNLFEIKTVYSSGVAYGINSILGIDGQLFKNSNLSLFAEINSLNASFGPKRGEVVKSIKDGVDNLDELGMNKFIIFKDKHINDGTFPSNPDKPVVATRRYYAFSSLGLKVGMKIQLYNE